MLEYARASLAKFPPAYQRDLQAFVAGINRFMADHPDRRPAWVEITLASSGEDLIVHVLDSGAGVPSGTDIFGYGVTSRAAADGHGIGLVLARQTARSHGGDVLLADAGGNEHGAVFTARLPGVISSPEAP